VPKDLSGNISGCGNFDTGTDHFEWTPVLVFDQVSDEFFACFCIKLIAGIGHTGAIGNEFLRISDTKFFKFSCGLTVAEQANIHYIPLRSLSVSG
jgi:hypothetical protein